ncbi:MAG: DHHA1 domain-containing protein, partial [Candidatus Izemoplasmatales bacterium]|nr:DHHA1 domain-containing protein [Candidatus Izemoplasmatales bacterium]
GAIAEFGEKYGDYVRTIDLKYTLDLCGGTHVKNISDIGRFAIKSLSSIGSGIYRIEALVNKMVSTLDHSLVGLNQDIDNLINKADKILLQAKQEKIEVKFDFVKNHETTGSYQDVLNRRIELQKAQIAVKELEKEYNRLKEEKTLAKVSDLSEFAYGDKLIAKLENVNAQVLKQLADDEIAKGTIKFVFLASVVEDKIIFIAKSAVQNLNAGQLVKQAAIICGGNGGGRADFAQAGGKDIDKVDEAIDKIKELVL